MNDIPVGSSADKRLHIQWKSRAEKAEAEVERLARQLMDAHSGRDDLLYTLTERIQQLEAALRALVVLWRAHGFSAPRQALPIEARADELEAIVGKEE